MKRTDAGLLYLINEPLRHMKFLGSFFVRNQRELFNHNLKTAVFSYPGEEIIECSG
jgi:hypothetical protein